MKVIRCDRCKKDIIGEVTVVAVGPFGLDGQWDLCEDCTKKIKEVLKGFQ